MKKHKITKAELAWLIAAVVCVIAVAALTACMVLFLFVDWKVPQELPITETEVIQETEVVENVEVGSANDFAVVEVTQDEVKQISLGEFVFTAYCSCEKCCGIWAQNRPVDDMGKEIVYGASGSRLFSNRSVAVDPSVIPYGTEIIVDGLRYVAHDCGGAIKGNRIDVYFDSHEEALQFGRQVKPVYVEEIA